MTPRRATHDDAGTLARLNAHVQSWHAAHYPEAFFPDPDPQALTAYFADRLTDPACTAFLTGDPATAYALCQLHIALWHWFFNQPHYQISEPTVPLVLSWITVTTTNTSVG